MTNEEILKKVIERVQSNGYRSKDSFDMVMRGLIIKHMWFDHNFAKAFWEDKELEFKVRGGIVVTGCSDKCTANVDFKGAVIPCCAWQYHLQQMVLEEDPIKYLEKFL